MKTIAVWILAATVMVASHPSFAFDPAILFHAVVAKGMKESSAPRVAPPVPETTAELPWEGGTVTLPLDVDKSRCTADTYIAAAQGQLSDEELTALDKYCRGKSDKNPLASL